MTPQEALHHAIVIARTSPCAKSRRGVVIFNEHGSLANGVNMPALGTCTGTAQCRLMCNKICVHAEQDALYEALVCHGQAADGSVYSLLHVKIQDDMPVPSGSPSCVECSKAILSSGIITTVWLLHDAQSNLASAPGSIVVDGLGALVGYAAEEFHRKSLEHHGLAMHEARRDQASDYIATKLSVRIVIQRQKLAHLLTLDDNLDVLAEREEVRAYIQELESEYTRVTSSEERRVP